MGPALFQNLPWVVSFAVAVGLVQGSMLLLATGRRFFKQVSLVLTTLVAALVVGSVGFSISPVGVWVGIGTGLIAGALVGRYVRPVGVGLTLSYLAFSVAGNLVSTAYIGWVAALVIFAYGLLLTDLAPTFVSSLLGCSILLLLGEWAGVIPTALFVLTAAVGAARVMASVLPSRLAVRGQSANLSS